MLTDIAVKSAIPKDKPYKLADGHGLHLLVKLAGKYWRMDYRFKGKRKTLAIGVYPKVGLKVARKKCHEARELLEQDLDPMEQRKLSAILPVSNSVKSIALEWYSKNKHTWVVGHAERILRRLELNIFPWLGDTPILTVSPMDLLTVLRRIEDRGAIDTAHRAKQVCGKIWRYAVSTGRAEHDITAALNGALPPPKRSNMSTITDPGKVGELLRAIHGYEGHFTTCCALRLAPLVFLRPGELRRAEWTEIDLDKAEWKIPEEKMKMSRPHIIPLSKQALKILHEIRPYTAHRSIYVFPSIRSDKRPMSDNTILAALRRMGYSKEEMTGHGFRAMASTLLHENGWGTHLIELQLAHVEKNSVKAAYNHALYLDDRIKMMQWWADELDKLKG